ncbi:MAG: hypothetical protein R3B95_06755 [Nitrospirales bacterium]|nr:hypothetical protein [Nitrospirales bacterium]
MPPFGKLYGLEVFVDQSLTEDEEIVFQAGTHLRGDKAPVSGFCGPIHPQ